MDKINLPISEKEISRIGLGTWAIGGWMWGGTDEMESIKTIHSAIDRGINFIDTAPVYGYGRSEEIIGKALEESGQRSKIVVATKVGIEWDDDGKVFRNSSKERILKEIDDSLIRLQTDYIDLYQIHWPDPLVPIEETAEIMKKLFDEGKIKAIGVSNFSTAQMEEFQKAAPLHACQPPYNLFEREIESDVIPYCKERNITLITYSALCRGLLTGKLKPDSKFKGDDLRNDDPKFNAPYYKDYLMAVEKLNDFALENFDKKIIHLAVRWILDKGINIALWGARHPKQLSAIDEMWDWRIDESSMKEIDKIINDTISEKIGPEFMAPPERKLH